MGLKAEVTGLSQRCHLAEEREAAANERARLGEERASMLTMELAKSRAEVKLTVELTLDPAFAGLIQGVKQWS